MASFKAWFNLAILEATDKSTVLSPTSTTKPPKISELTLLVNLKVLPAPTNSDLEMEASIFFKILESNLLAEVTMASTTPLWASVKTLKFLKMDGNKSNLLFSPRTFNKLETEASMEPWDLAKTSTTTVLSSLDKAGLDKNSPILASDSTVCCKEVKDLAADSIDVVLAAAVYKAVA
ncbi:hypothetical protein WICPIJ_006452 [Wickerhamomyces pijperi]|uniref:Uncharacterized protein n=1 Tax=Wickerhamomyces pijperi TaxID=599730 RepID=A0A9P8Q1P6_WICPI|nr:hypothetical protein WICPIJ_006452 [Wickerhamomyces pijperi]